MAGRAGERGARRNAVRRPRASADGLPSSERVFRQLQNMIIDGEMGPGTRLVELSLATQFGVSRTPVREALKRLVDGNLLLADPIRGLVVRTPEAAEVEEVYLVREVLDGLAARLAAQRVGPDDLGRLRVINDTMREGIRDGRTAVIVNANIAFHDLIYSIAGNRTLARHGMELRNFVRRFSSEAFVSPSRVDAVLRDHERLLEALERGDSESAERASTEHLRKARAYVAELHVRRAVGVPVDGAGRA
ncbi:MAG TPA: GntR family transcriptional regulator [Candidatus Limnocylindria bacterium]|jgi:DNA-binding GntR family transcriptional regulator|nr:GntR family transcriptional regulator [Candidatus Limnocylindria bacterium]